MCGIPPYTEIRGGRSRCLGQRTSVISGNMFWGILVTLVEVDSLLSEDSSSRVLASPGEIDSVLSGDTSPRILAASREVNSVPLGILMTSGGVDQALHMPRESWG